VNKLYEELVPVTALEKTATSTATHATKTIPFGDFRRVMFYALFEATAGNLRINHDTHEKMTLTLIQRKGLTGDTNNLVTNIDVKAGEGVIKMIAENVDDWENDAKLTINGVTFTKKSGHDATAREFTDGAELEAMIEAALPHIDADDSSNDVTIEVNDVKDRMTADLDIGGSTADDRLSILECAAFVEAHISDLTAEYDSLHLNVSGDDAGTVNTTVFAILANPYSKPVEQPAHQGVHVPV